MQRRKAAFTRNECSDADRLELGAFWTRKTQKQDALFRLSVGPKLTKEISKAANNHNQQRQAQQRNQQQ
jgi:hypothetical protein